MSGNNGGIKLNIPMCIACVLLCLTLLSVHLTSGLYSRYTSSASGSDSARVVKFGDITLTETGDFYRSTQDSEGNITNEFFIGPGMEIGKQLEVSFEGSEAATYVFVIVKVSDSKWGYDEANRRFYVGTDSLEWKVQSGWEYLKQDGFSRVFYKFLAPGTELEEVPFIADGKIKVSGTINETTLNDMNGTGITFQAKAVQAGGFDDPATAWESVKNR